MAKRRDSASATQPSFEQLLTELEQIVTHLEQGELPLEQALQQFEQGIQLARQGQQRLQQAEQRIQILVNKNDEEMLVPWPEAHDHTEPTADI